MEAGSQVTLSAVGAPVTASPRVCPNGPDCSPVTGQRLNGSSQSFDSTSASRTGPAAFTTCALYLDGTQSPTGNGTLAAAHDGVVSAQWGMFVSPVRNVELYVYDGISSTFSAVSAGVLGGVHRACCRYVYSGTPGTTSTSQCALDGTLGSVSNSQRGPIQTLTSTLSVGGWLSVRQFAGTVFGSFYTETDLGSTRIAALTAWPSLTGAKGEPVTVTRTGPRFCPSSNGEGTVLPANRPCISGGAVLAESTARTNSGFRFRQFNDAVWTILANVGGGSITADQALAPDGTFTADRLVIPATSTGQYSYISQGGFAAAQAVDIVWIRGNGTSGTINLLNGSTPNACRLCSYNPTTWTPCHLATLGTAATFVFIGNDSFSATCGTGAKGAQDVFLWGYNHQEGTFPTTSIPTENVAVTRGTESVSFTPALSTGTDFSWAENFVSPQDAAGCAGFFPMATSTGPVLYSCFSTGVVSRIINGANLADSPTTCLFSSFKWQTGIRWGGTWNRTTHQTTCHVDGVESAPGTAQPLVGSSPWTTITLAGDGYHSLMCFDPRRGRCR
jgi:hypothetical protein